MNAALEIVQTVLVLITTVVAVMGINSWRAQLIGGKRIELAEDVLARFYQAADAIRYMRNPFTQANEGRSRPRGERESDEEAWALDSANVPFERYNSNREVFNELRSLRYRFMAQHGKNAVKPFDDLNAVVGKIFAAANSLARTHWRQRGATGWDEAREQRMDEAREKAEAVFWWDGTPEDPINDELDTIIDRIESICRPYIERETNRKWRRWPL